MIKATPVEINWHRELPIFASEPFLRAVGDSYGWLGGIDESGRLLCILPYTIIRKGIFRMVRFRVETIPVKEDLDVAEERAFLNSAIEYFRDVKADTIIPATTNTIFRTYPDGAHVAPYGSYVVDLSQPEDTLWRNISRIMRQNIKTAMKNDVNIRSGMENLDAAYKLIDDTFRRSRIPFMSYAAFSVMLKALGKTARS